MRKLNNEHFQEPGCLVPLLSVDTRNGIQGRQDRRRIVHSAGFFILSQLVFLTVMYRGWRAIESTGRALSTVLLLVFPLSLIVVFSSIGSFPRCARQRGHKISGGAFVLHVFTFIVLTFSSLGLLLDHRILTTPLILAGAVSLLLMFLAQLMIVGRVAPVYAAEWQKRMLPQS